MSIVKKSFGKLADGRETDLYILTNATGASVEITNYGGIIRAINVPDKDGKLDSVVLGYNDVSGYVPTVGYIGALIGRVGNRIANGECVLNGQKLTDIDRISLSNLLDAVILYDHDKYTDTQRRLKRYYDEINTESQ